MTESELERIRNAYRARDADSETPYRWDNPGYVAYMQSVERAVLRALGDVGVPLRARVCWTSAAVAGTSSIDCTNTARAECHGIDLMENRIAEGRERYPTLELVVGSATELPYADGAFDLVTQFTCLSSILDDDVRLAVAREMQRVATGAGCSRSTCAGSGSADSRAAVRARCDSTQTVALDRHELIRLFGEPAVLRRETLTFGLAELTGSHPLIGMTLGALPFLRSHCSDSGA